MSNAIIYKSEVKELIKSFDGKVFTCQFIKKDGSERVMNCRLGVTKHLKGGELKYNPSDYAMLPVFDMQKKEYRMIQLESVHWVKCDGVTYVIR